MLVDPQHVTLSTLEAIYRGALPELIPECRQRVDQSASDVAKAAAGDKPIYGVNTGFGKLASVRISAGDTQILQRKLILGHCAGVGDPLCASIVRLTIALKIISLGRGASGIRWELIALLTELLRHGIIPVVPAQGSVGASGDLVPLAHLTATMIAEGDAVYRGKRMPAFRALQLAGLSPVKLHAKEGLAMINGTQVSTALALTGLFGAWRNAISSLVTGALSTDAAMGSSEPFRAEIQQLRGHKGQIDVASTLRRLLQDSQIRKSHRHGDQRVQDPYCLRCQPQVLGAVLTVLRQAGDTLRIEASAVTDNPLVLEDGSIVAGGNFHGEPVGLAADQIAMAIAETGAIAQRRIALLVDPVLSHGLPAFLSPNPGLNSGMMAAEVVSAALASENKALSNPRVVDSTPTSANQEDHVAMSCHAAFRLLEMNQNLARLLAIEALCAVQGVELRRPHATSPELQGFARTIRAVSEPLHEDRTLASELEEVACLIQDGKLIPAHAPGLETQI